jgi:hypothetical protein
MKINTASGLVSVNARSAYGKWLQGWKAGGGWTGWGTLADAWKRAQTLKTPDVSWSALGRLMASEQSFGYALRG